MTADPQENKVTTTFSVRNFGPIVRADVELRPLTIFAGPSNTGKSYLATLIYAICKTMREELSYWPIPSQDPEESWGRLSQAEKRAFTDWRRLPMGDPGKTVVPAPISDHMRKVAWQSLRKPGEIERSAAMSLLECFGTETPGDLMRRKSRNPATATVSVSGPRTPRPAWFEFSFTADKVHVGSDIDKAFLGHVRQLSPSPWARRFFLCADPKKALLMLLDRGIRHLTREAFPLLVPPVHYIPANRTGAMHSHHMTVRSLLGRAPSSGLRPSALPPGFSGVFGDFLANLAAVNGAHGKFRGIEGEIQDGILRGSIDSDTLPGTNYPSFYFRPSGWKEDRIPLSRASSMVSEMAPIVLHLRHIALPDDLLIIEEPEAHLHPEQQAHLAVQLARLVRAGLRIIVTTHSEWMLEQFANLVVLSVQPERTKRQIEKDRPDLAGGDLGVDQVGAWCFKSIKRPPGGTVRESKFDLDVGVLPMDYTRVATTLYNDWAEMAGRVKMSMPRDHY